MPVLAVHVIQGAQIEERAAFSIGLLRYENVFIFFP